MSNFDNRLYTMEPFKSVLEEIIEVEDAIIDERGKGVYSIESNLKLMYDKHRELQHKLNQLKEEHGILDDEDNFPDDDDIVCDTHNEEAIE